MTYKTYNRQYFETTINNITYSFTCYGQGTRHGFRHICYLGYNDLPKQFVPKPFASVSWMNRTWEYFRYEKVLNKAINNLKVDENTKQQLKDVLIEQRKIEEKQQSENDFKAFQTLYNGCSNVLKDKLKDVNITNEAQAKALTTLMKFDNTIQQLKEV